MIWPKKYWPTVQNLSRGKSITLVISLRLCPLFHLWCHFDHVAIGKWKKYFSRFCIQYKMHDWDPIWIFCQNSPNFKLAIVLEDNRSSSFLTCKVPSVSNGGVHSYPHWRSLFQWGFICLNTNYDIFFSFTNYFWTHSGANRKNNYVISPTECLSTYGAISNLSSIFMLLQELLLIVVCTLPTTYVEFRTECALLLRGSKGHPNFVGKQANNWHLWCHFCFF